MYPTAPGAIIGYRRNGTPIRLQAGGSEPDPASEPATPPAAAAEPAAPDPAGIPAPPVPGPVGDPAPDPAAPVPAARDVADLPDWAQRIVREARADAGKYRTQLRETEQRIEGQLAAQKEAIARALGLAPEEVTPEQLTAQRDQAHQRADAEAARARTAQVELATFRAASAMGADLGKLMDSRTFVATLDGLDPSSDGFDGQVRDKVAAALETNPGFRLAAPVPAAAPAAPAVPVPPPLSAPPVPASGPQGSFASPPPPGGRQLTDADAAHMTPAEVVAAVNNGAFSAEGFGPSRKLRR